MNENPITFLRDRWTERLRKLEEDELIALTAVGTGPDSQLRWVIDRQFHVGTPYIRVLGIYSSPRREHGHTDPDQLEHIARWDPANVLELIRRERADINARQRLLAAIERRLNPSEPKLGWTSADAETDGLASDVIDMLVAGERA